MATRKSGSARRATSARTSTRRRTPRRRTRTAYPRRRRPGLPTTIGAALGMLLVTTLLEASWPVRIALAVGVLVLGVGYVIWKNRAEITAAATPAADEAAQPLTDPTVAEGDSSHD
ncbi:MAG TPA: hypothetical protein VFT81_01570 [Dermatophilaceae bacterium]|nr:hypothetical protein [Dermatophilaceae bacterium]